MAEEDKQAGNISRRSVIASAALVPVAAITSAAQSTAAESALSASQLRTLEAFVDRMIPKDELGPSASESGVPVYINRSLGDYLARGESGVHRRAGGDGRIRAAVRRIARLPNCRPRSRTPC